MTKSNYKMFTELIGWCGLLLILVGFRLASVGRGMSLEYTLVNLSGSGLLVWNCKEIKAYPIMILNAVLFIMATWSLIGRI